MTEEFRSVETAHYHVWTDALHARELARRTKDRWNRGSYVRWTIISACTALEIACEQYLHRPVGHRFKENVNDACDAIGVQRLDWGSGLWQRVLEVRSWRHDSVHVALPEPRRFAPVAEAEEVVEVVRSAVLDIASRTGHTKPVWIQDDVDNAEGRVSGGGGNVAHVTVTRAGVAKDDPDVIRISYVHNGKEWETEQRPPDPNFDPAPVLEAQAKAMRVPISAVRAYRGATLLKELKLSQRGS